VNDGHQSNQNDQEWNFADMIPRPPQQLETDSPGDDQDQIESKSEVGAMT
jgi:hypothetical protein